MKYGNYIINAEPALEMSNVANNQKEVAAKNFSLKQAEAELRFFGSEILKRANEGWKCFSWWIRYQSTYDKLIELGYDVYGGVIYENLSPEQQQAWGTGDDRFIIKWTYKNQEWVK